MNDNELTEENQDFAFQAVNGFRESMSIAKRQANSVSYEAALDIISEVNPEAYEQFANLLTKRNKSDDVRYYIEKAEALSTDEKEVFPIDLINADLKDVEATIELKKGKATSLQKRKISLLGALQYFKPREISEHKVLNRDFYLKSIKLPDAINIYEDEQFADYKLSDDRYLRLRLLHPDKEEHILGCDLIYEQFDLENDRVRFVHVQYKLWGKQGLYFSQGNMMAQVEKVCNNLCNDNYCNSPMGNNVGDGFRFPFCSGFLRPTDKQIDNSKDMSTTTLHIPMCHIMRLSKSDDIVKLDKAQAKASGVGQVVFNELFINGFLGSRWFAISDLEKFYALKGIDSNVDGLRVHAQEFLVETESKKSSKTGM